MYETISLDKLVSDYFEKSFQKIIIYNHNFRLNRFFRDLEEMFGVIMKTKEVKDIVIIDTKPFEDFSKRKKEVERILTRYGFKFKIT